MPSERGFQRILATGEGGLKMRRRHGGALQKLLTWKWRLGCNPSRRRVLAVPDRVESLSTRDGSGCHDELETKALPPSMGSMEILWLLAGFASGACVAGWFSMRLEKRYKAAWNWFILIPFPLVAMDVYWATVTTESTDNESHCFRSYRRFCGGMYSCRRDRVSAPFRNWGRSANTETDRGDNAKQQRSTFGPESRRCHGREH